MLCVSMTSFAQHCCKSASDGTCGKSENGWRGFMETGYTFGDKSGERFEFSPSFGYRLNPQLFIGVGAGLNYYTEIDEMFLPVFAHFRGYMPVRSKIHPFVDVKPGYGFDLNGDCNSGFYVSMTTGVEIGHLSVGIGYASQTMTSNENLVIDNGKKLNVDATSHSGGLTVKAAYLF